MEIKKIRKLMALISGSIAAIVAVVFLLILDTKVKISVAWLMGIAIFGIAGGILLVISTFNSEDEEDKKSPILALLATACFIGLVILMILLPKDATYLKFVNEPVTSSGKSNQYLVVLYYITMVVSCITCAITLFHSITLNRDHFAYLKIAGEKGKRKIKILNIVVPVVSFTLIILAFVLLATLNTLDASYVSGTLKNSDGTVRWTESVTITFKGIGTYFGTKLDEIIEMNKTYRLPLGQAPEASSESFSIVPSFNALIALSIMLIIAGVTSGVLFRLDKETRKSIVLKTISGAMIFVSGAIMLFSKNQIIDSLVTNNKTITSLLAENPNIKFTYTLGSGIVLFASLISISGFILTIFPLFDIKLASDDNLVSSEFETF